MLWTEESERTNGMVLLGRSHVHADVTWVYASSGWYMVTLAKASVGPRIDPGLEV